MEHPHAQQVEKMRQRPREEGREGPREELPKRLATLALHTRHNSSLPQAEATQATGGTTELLEQGEAEHDEQGLVTTNPLTMQQWQFSQVAARHNDADPIEEWECDSGGATHREDPPMPKAARRGKAWVGAQAPFGNSYSRTKCAGGKLYYQYENNTSSCRDKSGGDRAWA